jgi:hypothetical protein
MAEAMWGILIGATLMGMIWTHLDMARRKRR